MEGSLTGSVHGGHGRESCCHAADAVEEILLAHVEAGSTNVAVTEHLFPPPGFEYEDEKELGLKSADLEKRFAQLMDVRRPLLHQQFDPLFRDFRIGFETEYCGPRPLEFIEQAVSRYQPEIIVASIHHVEGFQIDGPRELYQKAAKACGGFEELELEYYRRQYDLIQFVGRYSSTIPVVLGHMDLIKLGAAEQRQKSSKVVEQLKRNIKAAVAAGFVFEINARGVKKGVGLYPDDSILQLIAQAGGAISFGDDAHAVADVCAFYPLARKTARRFFSKATFFEKTPNGYRRIETEL